MKKLNYLLIVYLLFILNSNICFGEIINVPAEFSTINEAIGNAVDGDTVLVDTGTYVENVYFNGKNIVVASNYILDQNTEYILKTIIDGSNPYDEYFASCVGFIDGAGLEKLLWARDYCHENHCQLKLAGLDENCEKILEVTRLANEFDRYVELAEAVKSFV